MRSEHFEVRRAAPRKDKVVRMRLSADQLASIENAAADADMTMSAFLRSLLLEGAGVQPMLAAEDRTVTGFLADEMRAVGTNLNQMARALNSGGPIRPADLEIIWVNIRVVVAAVLAELRTLPKRAGNRRRGEG